MSENLAAQEAIIQAQKEQIAWLRSTLGEALHLISALSALLSSQSQSYEQDIARILNRLDVEIPEAQARMDELLTRLKS